MLSSLPRSLHWLPRGFTRPRVYALGQGPCEATTIQPWTPDPLPPPAPESPALWTTRSFTKASALQVYLCGLGDPALAPPSSLPGTSLPLVPAPTPAQGHLLCLLPNGPATPKSGPITYPLCYHNLDLSYHNCHLITHLISPT